MDEITALLIKWGLGGLVSVLTFLFGGWSMLLAVLCSIMLLDYISGVIASGYEGKVLSSIGRKGIARKFMSVVMVSAAHLIDVALGTDYIMAGVTFVVISNELVSILENAGRSGVKVPEVLKNAIQVLKDKGNDGK